jgi:sugar phosphate permease
MYCPRPWSRCLSPVPAAASLGTVGSWMPYYLSTEKHWSTQEYSAFYVCWGIVGFFGLWLAGWLADRIGRRVGFIAMLIQGAIA